MSLSKTQADAVTGLYSLVRKSGFLNTGLGRKLFSSSYFLYKRYWEDSLAGLIKKRPELFRGGYILDVGANIGYTASLLAGAVEAAYKVYAFEPDPSNYSYLKDVVKRRQSADRLVGIQAAVGDQDGKIELWLNEHHHGDHRILTDSLRAANVPLNSVSVPIVRLDTFTRERFGGKPVAFIKIDVQGYELAVFQGMEETVKSNPNLTITVEYMPEALKALGFEPSSLLNWLRERSFIVYQLHASGDLEPGPPSVLEENGYVDLVCTRNRLI